MAPKNGPPDQWMDYSPMGERISGTRFICMKVPLKQGLSRNIEENSKFSCENAIEMASKKGHKIGLVIDLSFTSRYYDPRSFEENDVAHKKIFMPGRVLPNKDIVESFSDSVLKFEDENKDNDDLIAVHCTHGLNRTGYMICKYLIDKKNLNPEAVIKAFEEARGHRIEREIYLNDLLGKASNSTMNKPKNHTPKRRSPSECRDNPSDPPCTWEQFHPGYQDSRMIRPYPHPDNCGNSSWFDIGYFDRQAGFAEDSLEPYSHTAQYDGYNSRWLDYNPRHGSYGSIPFSYHQSPNSQTYGSTNEQCYSDSYIDFHSERPSDKYHQEVRSRYNGIVEHHRRRRESPYYSDFPNRRHSRRHTSIHGNQYW